MRATTRLRDLLTHLYVLVPVLDDAKHYFVGDEEVAKLLRHGEGWLAAHPERELIAKARNAESVRRVLLLDESTLRTVASWAMACAEERPPQQWAAAVEPFKDHVIGLPDEGSLWIAFI